MIKPIRIALHIQPQHAEFTAIRAAVVRGKEMGVDAISNWDHFFPIFGDDTDMNFEAWTMLSSWAEGNRTRRDRNPGQRPSDFAIPNCSPTWLGRWTTLRRAG